MRRKRSQRLQVPFLITLGLDHPCLHGRASSSSHERHDKSSTSKATRPCRTPCRLVPSRRGVFVSPHKAFMYWPQGLELLKKELDKYQVSNSILPMSPLLVSPLLHLPRDVHTSLYQARRHWNSVDCSKRFQKLPAPYINSREGHLGQGVTGVSEFTWTKEALNKKNLHPTPIPLLSISPSPTLLLLSLSSLHFLVNRHSI